MTSQIHSYVADLLTQIVTPATTVLKAYFSEPNPDAADLTAYVAIERTGFEMNCQSVIDCIDRVSIVVYSHGHDDLVKAMEDLQVILFPYTSANAMYAHGVIKIVPVGFEFAQPQASASGVKYGGQVVFEFTVRYTYS